MASKTVTGARAAILSHYCGHLVDDPLVIKSCGVLGCLATSVSEKHTTSDGIIALFRTDCLELILQLYEYLHIFYLHIFAPLLSTRILAEKNGRIRLESSDINPYQANQLRRCCSRPKIRQLPDAEGTSVGDCSTSVGDARAVMSVWFGL